MGFPGSPLPLGFLKTEEKQRYSVSSLTRAVKAEIEETFGEVLVEGEIGNFKHHSSGHLYFILKDERAQLQAVMFRGDARRLRFDPAEGAAVLARGNLTVYERRGNYQIVVRELTPLGLGALQEAFEKLKEKLRKEGLFDEARKRPLPLLPMRIGIVTSPSGAAIRDMLKVLRRRFENVQVLLYPARVQGEGAAGIIADGIRELNRQGGLDVLIVGRGGGSIEDLWAFNEEVVARAIAASETPVVSAVGHEVDFTIADFVADVRAATPSAAAEIVVQSKEELKRRLEEMKGRLVSIEAARVASLRGLIRELRSHRALARPEDLVRRCQMRLDELSDKLVLGGRRIVERRRQAVSRLSDKLLLLHPRRSLRSRRERIDGLRMRLVASGPRQVCREREQLTRLSESLRHLSPLAVMERGYAMVTKGKSGRAVKRADEVTGGDRLHVRLHEGELDVRVLGGGGKRSASANETQPSLFEEES